MNIIVKEQAFKRHWLYTTLTHGQVPRASRSRFQKSAYNASVNVLNSSPADPQALEWKGANRI